MDDATRTPRASRIRLRQVCIVVERLEPVLDRLIDVFGLQVGHGKGDLSRYGLPPYDPPAYQKAFFQQHGITGALLPVGQSFLELIAPLRGDVPAARYLQRRGEGGYMVITEVDDADARRRRAAMQGVRIAGRADYPTYDETQLDPRDLGGAILSFSMQREGQPFDGGWFPAGHHWRDRVAPGWDAIEWAELVSPRPQELAARWAGVIERPAAPQGDGAAIRLDEGEVRFAAGEGPERLAAVGLAGREFQASFSRASAGERVEDGQHGRRAIRIAGVEFREARA